VNIKEEVDKIQEEGYSQANAQAKFCQDMILDLISKSSLNRNVTIKGGVVMRSISADVRRATQDIDIDFIRYSLEENSIKAFVDKLNIAGDVTIKMVGNIEELRQQDYNGKRIYIEISDEYGTNLLSKIDLGVHKRLEIVQEEYCFDIEFNNEGASLLINSKEQMLTEKLRSILKFGSYSTRFKDVYDIYYLLNLADKDKLAHCFEQYIYKDKGMRENTIGDIRKRVNKTLNDKDYTKRLDTSKKNWLDISNDEVIYGIEKKLLEL